MPTVLTVQLQLLEIVAQQIEKEIRFDRMRETVPQSPLSSFSKVCRFTSELFPQQKAGRGNKKNQQNHKSEFSGIMEIEASSPPPHK